MGTKKRNGPEPGDVFASRLADGRFGAVRVLRVVDRSALIAVTPWLGDAPPALETPLLRETLLKKRGFFENEADLLWVDGRPTEGLLHIGSLPPTSEEAAMECNVFGGKWNDQIAQSVLLEWQWEHDSDVRESFHAGVRARLAGVPEETPAVEPSSPTERHPMLAEEDFWALIELMDWSKSGDDDAVLAPLVKALAARPTADILGFEERLADSLYQLDSEAHAREIGEGAYQGEDEFFSVDAFLYARCGVVANGRTVFMRVKRDPSRMPEDLEFESLLSAASTAYEQSTGDDWEHVTSRSYETFSNAGGWNDTKS